MAVQSGTAVAIGHTAADDQTIETAVRMGATMSTHLFNGCAQLIDRHRNVIYSQLAEDALYVTLIADGHHIPMKALKVAMCAKGYDRVILVSDLAHLAGLPDGDYEIEGRQVVMRDGGIWVKDAPLLSGSARSLREDVEILGRQPQPGIDVAIGCATYTPARSLGCTYWSDLNLGRRGPIAVFRWDGSRLELANRIGF